MYSIITKWTPNSSTARYLSFSEIEIILALDNIENEQPIVTPENYNTEIFTAWLESLSTYRSYFLENTSGIDYAFFKNDQGTVITIQTFDSEETHTAVIGQSFYNKFVTDRQLFSNLVDITVEIKKVAVEFGTVDSFDIAELLFNNL
jgi:hypothetical protein